MKTPASVWFHHHLVFLSVALFYCSASEHRTLLFDKDLSGIPFVENEDTLVHNTKALTQALAELQGNTIPTKIIFPANATFYLFNGVRAHQLSKTTLSIDGELRFKRDFHKRISLPYDDRFGDAHGHPPACFSCVDCHDIAVTASSSTKRRGLIHGGGSEWWGIPFVGYLQILERRPYFFLFNGTVGLKIHNVVLQDAPFYNLQMTNVKNVEIHDMSIVSRRTHKLTHDMVDLSAFNTDGIDVAGHHVHVHDVDIWTQDDCIAIKDNLWSADQTSSNMTFERIQASGLGLTIGSISGTTVKDIVFRDSILYKTYKGIYMKFRMPSEPLDSGQGLVKNILYDNITMIEPSQWAIWIGPAQQTGGYSKNLCHAAPCSLCWPNIPFQTCGVPDNARYENITLQNIQIKNPKGSPGVILGGTRGSKSIFGITFDNVQVTLDNNDDQTADVMSLFPSLRYPIDDAMAQRTIVFVHLVGFAALLCFAVSFIRCCRANRRRRRNREESRLLSGDAPNTEEEVEMDGIMVEGDSLPENDDNGPEPDSTIFVRRKQRHPACVGCLVSILSVATISMSFVLVHQLTLAPSLHSPETYFVCEGVESAIARGHTSPVPNCFRDETKNDSSPLRNSFAFSVIYHQLILGLMLILAWAGYYVLMLRLRPTTPCWNLHLHIFRRNEVLLTTDEENAAMSDLEDSPHHEDGRDSIAEDSQHRSGVQPPPDLWDSVWSAIGMPGTSLAQQAAEDANSTTHDNPSSPNPESESSESTVSDE